MFPEDVILVIRGYQKRAEQWDTLLVNLAANIVAPPKKGKSLDVEKMHAFKQQSQATRGTHLEDPSGDETAAWLAAVKRRGK